MDTVTSGPYDNLADRVRKAADRLRVKPDAELVRRVYRDQTGLDAKPDEIDEILELVNPVPGLWVQVFGRRYDVPADILALVRAGVLQDWSGRDPEAKCPAFGRRVATGGDPVDVAVWVDHPDRNQRAKPSRARFTVRLGASTTVKTEDVREAVQAVKGAIARARRPVWAVLQAVARRIASSF
jgi:hypothetical protein